MTDRRQLEELEASARCMNQFLATLAHELRNPLAPIRSTTNVLELMPADEALVQRNVRIMSRQVAHMTRLVDDLLDIGRIAAGKMDLQRRLVAADEIPAASIEAAEPFLHAKSQRLLIQDDIRLCDVATGAIAPDRPIGNRSATVTSQCLIIPRDLHADANCQTISHRAPHRDPELRPPRGLDWHEQRIQRVLAPFPIRS